MVLKIFRRDKRTLIKVGTVLLVLVVLFFVGSWAKRAGKFSLQATTEEIDHLQIPDGATATGKVVLNGPGNFADFVVFLDYPSLIILNQDSSFSEGYRYLSAQVNSDGTFSLGNLPVSKKVILTATNGLFSDQLMATVPNKITTFKIGNFTVQATDSIPGTVNLTAKDSSGQPIDGGVVDLYPIILGQSQTAQLDSAGQATFNNVVPGSYTVLITKNLDTGAKIYSPDENGTFVINPGETVNLNLENLNEEG